VKQVRMKFAQAEKRVNITGGSQTALETTTRKLGAESPSRRHVLLWQRWQVLDDVMTCWRL